VVNVDDVALLEDEVFEILNEVVEFENISEPTVALKTSGKPVEKNPSVTVVMPPTPFRAPSLSVHEE